MEQLELIQEPRDGHDPIGKDSLTKMKQQTAERAHHTKSGNYEAPLPHPFHSPKSLRLPVTSFASESDQIERIEKELRGLKEILNTCMEKAVTQLSQRQIEMERWFKLSAAQGMRLDFPLTTGTERLQHTSTNPHFHSYGVISQPDSESVKIRSVNEEHFPRLEITASGFLQVKSSSSSQGENTKKGRKTLSSEESKSGASRSTSSKIDRIREQEGKIRKLLLGMKESIYPNEVLIAKKKPTINDCLGLTEFYSANA